MHFLVRQDAQTMASDSYTFTCHADEVRCVWRYGTLCRTQESSGYIGDSAKWRLPRILYLFVRYFGLLSQAIYVVLARYLKRITVKALYFNHPRIRTLLNLAFSSEIIGQIVLLALYIHYSLSERNSAICVHNPIWVGIEYFQRVLCTKIILNMRLAAHQDELWFSFSVTETITAPDALRSKTTDILSWRVARSDLGENRSFEWESTSSSLSTEKASTEGKTTCVNFPYMREWTHSDIKHRVQALHEHQSPDALHVLGLFTPPDNSAVPPIVRLGLHVLSIGANSATCERLFSVFGNTLTKIRNRMSKDLLQNLAELKLHVRDQHLQKKTTTKSRLHRHFGKPKSSGGNVEAPLPSTNIVPPSDPVDEAEETSGSSFFHLAQRFMSRSDEDEDDLPISWSTSKIRQTIPQLFDFESTEWVKVYEASAHRSFDAELELYDMLDTKDAEGEADPDVELDNAAGDLLSAINIEQQKIHSNSETRSEFEISKRWLRGKVCLSPSFQPTATSEPIVRVYHRLVPPSGHHWDISPIFALISRRGGHPTFSCTGTGTLYRQKSQPM
ncbi:hypothetical protein SISSUDRAFT_1121458 [Sistotremastrum suecicum HHB10207 ss-3]|uniref:HAT C-terminal dimerisation domain-containing protein n=1 Tax=Sistotremastrum suecicum HHB10207 ss-3 TaxID=1314776 RepID=A0A166ATD4_9AGAM|nr:hypothetical protein SISSUDRAFT_1121458 [Sistotremastrum suecicum HHB10207 ss-3]